MTATKTLQLSASTVDPGEGWLQRLLTPLVDPRKGPSAGGVVRLRRGALKRTVGALRGHYPWGIKGGRGS